MTAMRSLVVAMAHMLANHAEALDKADDAKADADTDMDRAQEEMGRLRADRDAASVEAARIRAVHETLRADADGLLARVSDLTADGENARQEGYEAGRAWQAEQGRQHEDSLRESLKRAKDERDAARQVADSATQSIRDVRSAKNMEIAELSECLRKYRVAFVVNAKRFGCAEDQISKAVEEIEGVTRSDRVSMLIGSMQALDSIESYAKPDAFATSFLRGQCDAMGVEVTVLKGELAKAHAQIATLTAERDEARGAHQDAEARLADAAKGRNEARAERDALAAKVDRARQQATDADDRADCYRQMAQGARGKIEALTADRDAARAEVDKMIAEAESLREALDDARRAAIKSGHGDGYKAARQLERDGWDPDAWLVEMLDWVRG